MIRFLVWFIFGAVVIAMLGFWVVLALAAVVFWLLRPRRPPAHRTKGHR